MYYVLDTVLNNLPLCPGKLCLRKCFAYPSQDEWTLRRGLSSLHGAMVWGFQLEAEKVNYAACKKRMERNPGMVQGRVETQLRAGAREERRLWPEDAWREREDR